MRKIDGFVENAKCPVILSREFSRMNTNAR
jgi:hypothetical protein